MFRKLWFELLFRSKKWERNLQIQLISSVYFHLFSLIHSFACCRSRIRCMCLSVNCSLSLFSIAFDYVSGKCVYACKSSIIFVNSSVKYSCFEWGYNFDYTNFAGVKWLSVCVCCVFVCRIRAAHSWSPVCPKPKVAEPKERKKRSTLQLLHKCESYSVSLIVKHFVFYCYDYRLWSHYHELVCQRQCQIRSHWSGDWQNIFTITHNRPKWSKSNNCISDRTEITETK